MNQWKVTIKDVLSREIFKSSKLVAGEGGLNREIKWTHILEMKEFESFVNGEELILTTGTHIQLDSTDSIPLIEKLIKKNVSGICIELGTNVNKIDPEVIQFVNKQDFPIIVFEQIVKFVDITQDLHTLIINHHHQMLIKLNTISIKFNEHSLSPNGIIKILKDLYLFFNCEVLLITDETKTFYYPPNLKKRNKYIHSLIEEPITLKPYKHYLLEDEQYTVFPIKGLGHSWGNLCLQVGHINLDEFAFSIIDRASLAIAQIMLRDRTIEERKQNQEEEIVQNLLYGKHHSAEINKVLPTPAHNLYYRLFLIETTNSSDINRNETDWEEVKLQRSIIVKSIFKKQGFFPLLLVTKDHIAAIASFYMSKETKKDTERFMHVLRDLKNLQDKNILNYEKCDFGISSLENDFTFMVKSYKEAKNVLLIQKSNISNVLFYEQIGVYRILIDLFNNGDLDAYVHDYLGAILDYDKRTKSELLETLSTYLNCMGSKKETAERLFIVRQTLYHRLEKIEELLGENFREPSNRQALELAISALNLLRKIPAKTY
ncbi:PucR family transcriptional regulator [Oceanobacillus sp. CF4.6]|uniref:PucR family transcriptional regulator n=1 Tax=Oceanobacillus sp. CF4.6 TaxID=3373080 RepID=UPI003EE72833